jgi:CRP-like cAMP-binding protein
VVEIIQDGETIDSLEKGSYFGEVALMQDVVRTASCLAATNCEVSILQKRDLDEVLDSFPQVRSRMEDAAHEALMRDVARTTDGRAQRTSSSGLPLSSVLRPMNPDESSLIDIEDGFAKADSGGRSRKSLMNIVNSIAEVTDDL